MKSLAALYSTRVSLFAGRAEVAGIKTAIAAVQFLDDFRAFGRILLFKLVAAGQLMARVAQWTGTASPLVGKDFRGESLLPFLLTILYLRLFFGFFFGW